MLANSTVLATFITENYIALHCHYVAPFSEYIQANVVCAGVQAQGAQRAGGNENEKKLNYQQ